MHALLCQQGASEIQPFTGIMVAADGKHSDLFPAQGSKKPVKQLYRLSRRYGFIINISCNQNSIHLLLLCQTHNLFQYCLLVLQHGVAIDPFAQMQVTQM